MKIHGIECPRCKERIWSRHRHDFRRCSCNYCFVDGGRDYTRMGWGAVDANGEADPVETAKYGIPQTVEIAEETT